MLALLLLRSFWPRREVPYREELSAFYLGWLLLSHWLLLGEIIGHSYRPLLPETAPLVRLLALLGAGLLLAEGRWPLVPLLLGLLAYLPALLVLLARGDGLGPPGLWPLPLLGLLARRWSGPGPWGLLLLGLALALATVRHLALG